MHSCKESAFTPRMAGYSNKQQPEVLSGDAGKGEMHVYTQACRRNKGKAMLGAYLFFSYALVCPLLPGSLSGDPQ